MNADEITLIRDIRRMFDKLPIDSSRMEIQTLRGNVTLSGYIKTMRSHPLEVLKDHLDFVEKRLVKDSRVKTLSIVCRVMQAEKKEHEHFAAPEAHPHGEGDDDQKPDSSPVTSD